MKYSQRNNQLALNELKRRRESAEAEAQMRKDSFIKEHPDFELINTQLAQTGIDCVRAAFSGGDAKACIENLKKRNEDYRRAKSDYLRACGLEEDYLEPHYTCKKCRDTGYVEGVVCSCYEALLKKYCYEELSALTPLQLSSFDDFDVSLYKDAADRQKMEKILKYCKDYAADFDTDSVNLFMYGETGLGKTHLSLAIAGKAIEKGFIVVYGSAQDFFTMIERERFGRSEMPDGTTEDKLLNCDLLILDDLGAEFITQFTVALLYNIVNTRIAKGLPTIINSNVSLEELEKQYSGRVVSRIIGNYQLLRFVGNDIRQVIKN